MCDGPTIEHCRKKRGERVWHIRRCRVCGHGFVANRPALDELRAIYAGETHHELIEISRELLETDISRRVRRIITRIARLTDDRDGVLDVGSGHGGFSFHLQQMGFTRLLLIDLDPRAAAAAQHIDGAEFRQCAFEDVSPADGPFAAIVMSQILEHALDPMDWLGRARALLSPGGVLAIALPNFGGVYRLLGSRDPMLCPPVHLNHFTPRSLRIALEASGLRVLRGESSSAVRVSSVRRRFSAPRRAAAIVWNALSRPLDFTTRGIILCAYAGRAEA